MNIKACQHCGKEFLAHHKAVYCSDACRKESMHQAAAKSRQRAKEKKRLDESRSKLPTTPVYAVLGYIDEHLKKTGQYLSYGKAVVMMEAERKAKGGRAGGRAVKKAG